MTNNEKKAAQLWKSALGELQLLVTRPSYETWLKGTSGVDYSNGRFLVGVPTTFVAEMLDQRMCPLISQVLERIINQEVRVQFHVLLSDTTINPVSAQVVEVESRVSVAENSQSPHEIKPLSGNPTYSVKSSPSPGFFPASSSIMHSRYTFENFIVGKSNELAHAASQAVSESPGTLYNPLFIYSGVGLGKTHLLHSIGHKVTSSGKSLIYVTTEEFTNQYIKAIRDGKTEEFRNHYRNADVLLLDDLQFIIGKEQTQEGFFHTFNALHMASKQIVVTSDKPSADLTLLESRIQSRLAGGLVVDIQPPDIETRLAILKAKTASSPQLFPEDVLQFIANRVHSNVRELEGCFTRLAAYSDLVASPITLDLAKRAIQNVQRPESKRRFTDTAVLDTVSSYFSVDKAAMRSPRRDQETARARQVAMYLLHKEANLPLARVGRFLGGKDHTTVLHACRRISARLESDSDLRRDLSNIRDVLDKP